MAVQCPPPPADQGKVRTSCRTALTAALVAAILGVPANGGPGAAASPANLEQLQAALTAATGRTVELGAALEQQAARDGGCGWLSNAWSSSTRRPRPASTPVCGRSGSHAAPTH